MYQVSSVLSNCTKIQDRRDGREKRRRLDKDQPRREMSPWTPPRPTSGSVIASTSEERIGHLEQLVDELKMRNNLLEQRSFQFAFVDGCAVDL
jgi:hypothetical protein